MNLRFIRSALAAGLFALGTVFAQQPDPQIMAVVQKVQEKLKAGQRSADALAPEIAEFEALRESLKGEPEKAGQVAYMQATLYLQVLRQEEKGMAMLEQIKTDYPGTDAATQAGRTLEAVKQRAAAQAAKAGLVGKPAPELTFTWASREDLKTLSALKGKVVVLDFWATWCGPCISSFPQIRELVAHYGDSDVVVLGVTSIQGRVVNLEPQPINTRGEPDREMALMKDFIQAKEITWPVVFSKEQVFNPEYGVTGIPHMTIIAPDGTVRHNGIHPAMPLEQKTEKIDAILKEFNLKVPTKA